MQRGHDPACAAGDQINALVPPIPQTEPAAVIIITANNGADAEPFAVMRAPNSPAFLSLDVMGHVAARHQDGSLVGPAGLYPGYMTPVQGGEIISIYGTGFGPPSSGSITAGSATQSGSLPGTFSCTISGTYTSPVTALVSPGLYQFNVTIPKTLKSGDNPISCVYSPNSGQATSNSTLTAPGELIAIQ